MTAGSRVSSVPKEARIYQGHRAGVITRSISALLDGLVVLVMLGVAYLAWAGVKFLLSPRSFTWPDVHGVLVSVVTFLGVATLYLAIAWMVTGRSYGCKVMGLRVVNLRGQRMRPVGALLRAAYCVFFPIGLFWCAVNRQNRSLADVLLRTSVIYDWESQHE